MPHPSPDAGFLLIIVLHWNVFDPSTALGFCVSPWSTRSTVTPPPGGGGGDGLQWSAEPNNLDGQPYQFALSSGSDFGHSFASNSRHYPTHPLGTKRWPAADDHHSVVPSHPPPLSTFGYCTPPPLSFQCRWMSPRDAIQETIGLNLILIVLILLHNTFTTLQFFKKSLWQ